jgi:hypothetical protein
VNERDIVMQSQHLAIENDSVFDGSGRQCLTVPDRLIREMLSGTHNIDGCSWQ